jgi:hypothetical protein
MLHKLETLVIENDKPLGIIINEAELAKLSIEQLHQAIKNYGPGELLVLRLPNGLYGAIDTANDDFRLVEAEIDERVDGSFDVASANTGE